MYSLELSSDAWIVVRTTGLISGTYSNCSFFFFFCMLAVTPCSELEYLPSTLLSLLRTTNGIKRLKGSDTITVQSVTS
jgi:hypothetical protein